MRGQIEYDEDLDAYEEDGYDQGEDRYEDEEEEGEEVEEEQQEYEEEPPKPTKEELEYLSYRQRLKESIRRQMKKESADSVDRMQDKNKKLPFDNFGSFFGPSQPVIARRVIEEGRSILETQHMRMNNSNSNVQGKKGPVSTTAGPRPVAREQPPVVINQAKAKVQKLRDTRDYSFLLSDDANIPAPANAPTSRNVPVPTSDARSAQVPSKSKPSVPNKPSAMSKPSRPISNGHEERKHVSSGQINRNLVRNGHEERRAVPNSREERRPVSTGREERRPVSSGREERRPVSSGREERRPISSGREERRPISSGREERRPISSGREDRSFVSNGKQAGSSAAINRSSQSRIAHSKVATGSRPDGLSTDSRKLLGSNNGDGPGRPVGSKGPLPKVTAAALDKKKTSVMGMKNATICQQKSPLPKSIPPQKQYAEQKKETLRHEKSKMMSKQQISSSKPLASSSKPQMRPPKQLPARPMQEGRPKKRPVYSDEEEDDGAAAISMIRKMFRYDPRKFQNDDDDSDMEANFDEILREERRSEKIARMEDEIELQKIEEEERRDRLRKEAKKRKLSHH